MTWLRVPMSLATGGAAALFADTFDGNLDAWTKYQESRTNGTGGITTSGGRLRWHITENESPPNTNGKTMWWNGEEGTFFYQELTYPFEIYVLNCGVGTVADSQVAITPTTESSFSFGGLMIHVPNMATISYVGSWAGHRGAAHYTLENKNTLGGTSNVVDEGDAALGTLTRCDLRAVMDGDGVLVNYYREVGDTTWIETNHTAFWRPDFSTAPTVYAGPVAYTYQESDIPIVGTFDETVLVSGGS